MNIFNIFHLNQGLKIREILKFDKILEVSESIEGFRTHYILQVFETYQIKKINKYCKFEKMSEILCKHT